LLIDYFKKKSKINIHQSSIRRHGKLKKFPEKIGCQVCEDVTESPAKELRRVGLHGNAEPPTGSTPACSSIRRSIQPLFSHTPAPAC
jgi:hypothetical protein